jgi:asparagine synthase (glutamine-hydrolysing)
MCGIAAILSDLPSDRVEVSLRAMLDAQFHRGPDDGGAVVISTGQAALGLGNRRLAIQDISPLGRQPMQNEDTGDILVYNGEIYNAPQLKDLLTSEGYQFRGRSDTEVLLRAYQHWGTDCLDRMRGMFAFAIWDARRSRLVIARDHLGIKPLYYNCNEHWFACASEVQALAKSGLISSDIDRRALAGYLAYGGVQEPLTIYENVFALPRGSWMEFDSCGRALADRRYWRFPPIDLSLQTRSLPSIVEEGRALLQQSVNRHLLSDVRLGVFLSAGLDSTAILGLTKDTIRANPLDSFTVSFPDRPEHDEHVVARASATRFGARFNQCPVSDSTALGWIGNALDCIDQPSMDGFNTYIVARAIRDQGIVVALSGLGGDEVFGGYSLFRRIPRTYDMMSWLNPLPLSIRKAAAKIATAFGSQVAARKANEIVAADPGLIGIYFHYRRLLSDFNLGVFGLNSKDLDLSEDFQVRDLRYEDCFVPADHVASVGRLDAAFYLQNILLRDSDVFGMANSLELRVPFLDRDLVDWAFRLPGNILLPRKAPLKHLLRKVCSDLYTKSQLKQPKRGFALPFAGWLQGPLRELMEENLHFLSGAGLLDPAGINLVRKLFNDEPNGPAWSRVWALVVLANWLKMRRLCPQAAVLGGQPA